MKKQKFLILIVLLTLILTPNVYAFHFFIPKFDFSNIFCTIFPITKKTIKNPAMPNYSIKIPCQWNYNWESFDKFSDGQIDYKLKINEGSVNRLTLIFFYFASGCAEDGCYRNPESGYTTINSKYLRSNGQDTFVNSYFGPIPHDVHYHSFVNNSGIKLAFAFSVGITNHVDSNARVIYAVGQKTNPARGTILMDDTIISQTF
jgi:hypothetical protein